MHRLQLDDYIRGLALLYAMGNFMPSHFQINSGDFMGIPDQSGFRRLHLITLRGMIIEISDDQAFISYIRKHQEPVHRLDGSESVVQRVFSDVEPERIGRLLAEARKLLITKS
jgi:hypothetical protein